MTLNNDILLQTKVARYLGVHLDNKHTWAKNKEKIPEHQTTQIQTPSQTLNS